MISFDNEIAVCMECLWEGQPETLRTVMKENEVNKQDKQLYEIKCCPNCGSELIEINETEDDSF